MALQNLRDMLSGVRGYAVGAFNIVDYGTMRAVVRAAAAERAPVILQTSVKTVKFFSAAALVSWAGEIAELCGVPVSLHLDHCKDMDVIAECIEAGYPSVMMDASAHPLERNIELTCQALALARARGVSVEGEIGAVPGVEDGLSVDQELLARPDHCSLYVERTGVDLLAPACGTAHGAYVKPPNVDFALIRRVADAVDVPLVLHGGTGLADEVFREAVRCGVRKINVSTELKHDYRIALEEHFAAHPSDYEPLGAMRAVEQRVERTVRRLIGVFGSAGKA